MPQGGSAKDQFGGGGYGSAGGIAGLGKMGLGQGGSGTKGGYFFDKSGNAVFTKALSPEDIRKRGLSLTPSGAKQDRFGNPILGADGLAKIDDLKKQQEHERRLKYDEGYQLELAEKARLARVGEYEAGVNNAFSIFDDSFYDQYGEQYGNQYNTGYSEGLNAAKQRIEDRFAPLGTLGKTHIENAFGDLNNYYTGLTDSIAGEVDSRLNSLRSNVDSAKSQFLASAKQDKASTVDDATARVNELKAVKPAPSLSGAFESFFAKNPFLIGGSGGVAATGSPNGSVGGPQNKGLVSVGNSGKSGVIVK